MFEVMEVAHDQSTIVGDAIFDGDHDYTQTFLASNEENHLISTDFYRLPAAPALFINKRFALNKMFQRNASKFAIFHV